MIRKLASWFKQVYEPNNGRDKVINELLDDMQKVIADAEITNLLLNCVADALITSRKENEALKMANENWEQLTVRCLDKLDNNNPEEESGDGVCEEEDGCPTEVAVLKREWRKHTTKINKLEEGIRGVMGSIEENYYSSRPESAHELRELLMEVNNEEM